jgi:hypothetical protein
VNPFERQYCQSRDQSLWHEKALTCENDAFEVYAFFLGLGLGISSEADWIREARGREYQLRNRVKKSFEESKSPFRIFGLLPLD